MNISYIKLSPSFFVNSTPQFSNHHQARLKVAFDLDLFLYSGELTPNGLVTAEFGHLRTASQLHIELQGAHEVFPMQRKLAASREHSRKRDMIQ